MTLETATALSETVDASVTTGPIWEAARLMSSWTEFPVHGAVAAGNLSTGDHFDLYDTSGPYTDPEAVIDLAAGLPAAGVVRDRALSCSGPRRRDHRGDGVHRRP